MESLRDIGRALHTAVSDAIDNSLTAVRTRARMEGVGSTVAETAARLKCGRGTLFRVLNRDAGMFATMALAPGGVDRGTADHWMRVQAADELARARRHRKTSGRDSACDREAACHAAW